MSRSSHRPALSSGGPTIRTSPSLASHTSSQPSLSLYTTTSSSTIWGPGALAGKAILALGKATVRAAERVIILRRLATIRAHLPCTDDDGGAESEFGIAYLTTCWSFNSRTVVTSDLNLWSKWYSITCLINCLSRWPLDDLVLLMMELMSVAMFCESGFLEPRLANAYLSALPQDHHPLQPPTVFIVKLMKRDETAFEAALLSKFLEFLLLAASQRRLRAPHKSVEDHTALAFDVLSAPPESLRDLCKSSLEQVWPYHHSLSLKDIVQHISETPPDRWFMLEANFLQREVPRLLYLAVTECCGARPSHWPVHTRRTTTFSLKFYICNMYGRRKELNPDFPAFSALYHLMCCVAFEGDHRDVLRHMEDCLRPHCPVPGSNADSYTRPESLSQGMQELYTHAGGHQHLQTLTTNLLFDLAAHDNSCKDAVLDAVVTLLLTLLIPEMNPAAIHDDLYRRCHFFPSIKRRPSYSKRTLQLFGIIRENRLASVIFQPGSRTSCQVAEVLEPIFNGVDGIRAGLGPGLSGLVSGPSPSPPKPRQARGPGLRPGFTVHFFRGTRFTGFGLTNGFTVCGIDDRLPMPFSLDDEGGVRVIMRLGGGGNAVRSH
ncbi:hypothetical protein GGX14DRAFT_404288 [Mycena pura]|uniref:Uncharacterized protein n=1 Tax=Mycena pura TaxID=153505 RepID=A0AAD6Y5E1_9AGAR|nr:hypothetical protein GGX14DRAFT_404288 [Mycena pura]